MSSQPRSAQAPSGSDIVGASAVSDRHASDDSIADTLIGALRACTPDYPPSVDYVRTTLVDYLDAARARGEPPERTAAAVRFMVSTILTNAVWSGANRTEARDLIRSLVDLCAAHGTT